jgi:hypothetical protein
MTIPKGKIDKLIVLALHSDHFDVKKFNDDIEQYIDIFNKLNRLIEEQFEKNLMPFADRAKKVMEENADANADAYELAFSSIIGIAKLGFIINNVNRINELLNSIPGKEFAIDADESLKRQLKIAFSMQQDSNN